MPRFPRPANAYAEYVVAGSRELARIPDGIGYEQAGAAPLAALTAWQAVVDTLAVGAGDRVLIHAASGGVGHIAVQLAKARGAEVWGTASTGNHELIRRLGVDHAIDYRSQAFEEVATGMDAVLDLVGSDGYPARSVRALKPGGRLVVVPSPEGLPDAQLLEEARVTARWILVEPDYAALERIAELIANGALEIVVGETRPIARVEELQRIGREGGPAGKLVATVA